MRLRFLLPCLLFSVFPLSSEAAGEGSTLAQALLQAGGTASVFEQPVVQAALKDPNPFLGETGAARFDRLLADAGLRRWQPPRVWLLQEKGEGASRRWENAAVLIQNNALLRAYPVVLAAPLASASEAIGFLSPGKVHPGLRGLLAAYDADMLVLLRGQNWTAWQAGWSRQGVLPGSGSELLADVIAEVAAAEQQWPEANGRPLLQLTGVGKLADFAAAQSGLLAVPGLQQLQATRVDKGRVWFSWSALTSEQLAQALQNDPRYAAVPSSMAGLPRRLSEACRLSCRQMVRNWQPEAAVKSPAVPAASVQSPPSP